MYIMVRDGHPGAFRGTVGAMETHRQDSTASQARPNSGGPEAPQSALEAGSPAQVGRTFDELNVGDTFPSSPKTLTQDDIETFAALSGDNNPVHLDEAFARGTPFRGRIAHGLLIQSVASGLAWRTGVFRGTIVALAGMSMRFESPVRPGDTIRVELSVLSKEPEPGPRRGHVRWRTRVVNQDGVTVIDGEWLTLLARSRPPRTRGEEPTK
jgi:3-hydroxybutyryl-CoA dehydratase